MNTNDYGLETKYCRPGEDITLTEGCRIEGYASLFGLADQGGDVVMPGAYRKSLARLSNEGRAVRMLWQHDATQPIGVWEDIVEDGRGLKVKGRILTEVEKGREAAALVAAGAIDGLSIGYRTVTAEKDAKGQRLLREVELWEVSLVTFPMLAEARVAAKGDTPEAATLRELAALFEEARRTLAAR
jgi:HK97 family phage prohead protease